ncbi:MAG: type II toxin-antitoxin system HicA family toxin [Candidatus Eremiobacteraeota bacterium]|nr:type II toxin-antitoxin system HicA family toxin [Candidatus Eremiobacteraeota bacterium]
MKFREVRRLLRADGWRRMRCEGSHEQWKHQSKPGTVTVAGHDHADVAPKTLRSIERQAGWR